MKIIFLGSQGSGKSTQAELLAKKLGLPHIEMGQLFRERAKDQDEEALLIKEALDAGNLVPDNVAVKTIKEKIARPELAEGYVLDGYPRNKAQLDGFDEEVDKVFYVRISDEEALKRLMQRGRADDNPEAIRRRLSLYHEQTEPLLNYFREKGILVEINGEKSIEEVENEIWENVKGDEDINQD